MSTFPPPLDGPDDRRRAGRTAATAEAKELHLLGVSFRTAPVAVRESLSFDAEQADRLLRALAASHDGVELFVLSTCNRTEFYLAAPLGVPAVEQLFAILRKLRPLADILHSKCERYQQTGPAAVEHLLRVACGLDSAILGDVQILGQIKAAMHLAGSAGSLGPWLQRALVHAIQAAKLARHQTAIGRGTASLGSAIAALLAEREIPLREAGRKPRVLLFGAGEIARDIARHVGKGNHRVLAIVNRTRARAEALAQDCGGFVDDWDQWPRLLASADFVIAATASREPVLPKRVLDHLTAEAPLLFIDAGVPRNIADGSKREVLNIDALRDRQESALAARRAAVPAVEQLVAQELARWEEWRTRRPLEGLLKKLFTEARSLGRQASGAFALDPAEAERAVHQSIQRLLASHARGLRRWARELA